MNQDPHRCKDCPECAVIFDANGIYGHIPDSHSKTCQMCDRAITIEKKSKTNTE